MEDYAHQLQNAINSGPINLENFILKTFLNPNSIKVLSDYMQADFEPNKKLMAITGVNLLNKERLNKCIQSLKVFWVQFYNNFMINNSLQWRHINLLIKSLQLFKEEFGQNFNEYFVQIFDNLSFKWKLAVYKLLIQNKETSSSIFKKFFTQSLQNFTKNGLFFIFQNHSRPTNISQEQMLIQNQFLKVFAEVLEFIQIQESQIFIPLKRQISKDQSIWQIILEQLLFVPNLNYRSLRQQSFSIQKVNLRYFGQNHFKLINQNKQNSFKMFQSCIKSFHVHSDQCAFDNSKFLFTLEQISPKILQQLIHIALQKNYAHTLKKFEGVISSMLFLIARAAKFIFLMNLFKSYENKVLFLIFPNFLTADNSQKTLYYQDPKQFIIYNCILFEDNLQTIQRTYTVKEACTNFLQQYLYAITQSSLYLVKVILDTIKFKVKQEEKQEKLKELFDIGYNANIQVCLFILNKIFIMNQKGQNQIHQLLRHNLIQKQYYYQFEGLDRVRFIYFTLYSFNYYFQVLNDNADAIKIVQYIYDSMVNTNQKAIYLISLQFIQNCITIMNSQVIFIIWKSILDKVRTSVHPQIIKLVLKIVKVKLLQMNISTVRQLLTIVIERINSQYSLQVDRKGSHVLYVCLSIIQEISQRKQYIFQQQEVVQFIWPLFQYFNRIQKIEYEDNILKIFNNLISAQITISPKFYSFLDCFNLTNKSRPLENFDNLTETYFLLILKGQSIFLSNLSQNMDLCNRIRLNLQANIISNRQNTFVSSYTLLQFLLNLYPQLVQQSQILYQKTLQLYQLRNNFKEKQTLCAALINYLMAYHISFRKGELYMMQQNKIQIFKGCQSRLLAVNLTKLMEIYAEQDFIMNILNYSMKLLHFLKQLLFMQSQKQKQKKYFQQISQKYISSDPFFLIQQSFMELKKKIGSSNFQRLISILQEHWPKKDIKELFMYKQVVDKETRLIATRQIAVIKKIY